VKRKAGLIVAEAERRLAAEDVDVMAADASILPSSVATIPLPPIEA
jgi:hypothetical protein